VASRVDDKTMSLQYLDMMKELAMGSSTKWIVPLELTNFAQGFFRNAVAATAVSPSNGSPPSAPPRSDGGAQP